MKKILISLVALFAILGIFCTQVQAKELGYISVSSEVTKDVEPNFAQFNVTVEKTNIEQIKAISAANETTKNVIAALKTLEPNQDFLKTSSFDVHPRYTWENGKQKFDTFVAKSTITVNVNDVSKVSEFMTTALKQGATTVNGLHFSLKSASSQCNDVLKQANLENLDKANAIASTMNKKVVSAKHINASCSQQMHYAQANKMLMSAKSDQIESLTSVPIEKGTIQLYVRVESEFYIK